MSQKSIAEIVVETLTAAGVKRIFGVVGDSLNGILDEIFVDSRYTPQSLPRCGLWTLNPPASAL